MHNLRRRRGDRGGAFRLSAVVFITGVFYRVFMVDHAIDPWPEFELLASVTGKELLSAAGLYVLYIALEPYVRRRWPQALISWTRLLAGRFRDPLVGRDILFGLLIGVGILLLEAMRPVLLRWLGFPPPRPADDTPATLLGGRFVIAALLDVSYAWVGLLIMFLLFVLRVIFRKQWLTAIAFIALLTLPRLLPPPEGLTGAGLLLFVLIEAVLASLVMVVSLRFGLLALCATAFVGQVLSGDFPVTLDVSRWYIEASVTAIGAVLAVAGYAFHTALAGRPLFKEGLLEA
jgi:hypothetical protein